MYYVIYGTPRFRSFPGLMLFLRILFVFLPAVCGAEERDTQFSGNLEKAPYPPHPLAYLITVADKELNQPLEGARVYDPAEGRAYVTDQEGKIFLRALPRLLVVSLPGYEEKRVYFKEGTEPGEHRIYLQIAGVLEAEELVVEAPAIGRTDEQVGISVVVTRDTVKDTAMIGIIEDVMNTVRMLPGVNYAGRYNPNLSVRGGEPGGLTHVLDGFLIKYPYHWGGMVSIFNPRLVDSVKLSAGIFPVRYGQATSGLLEIHSITPEEGLKWEVGTSISTLEGYVQTPLASDNSSGLLAGSRITHYDLIFALTGNFLEDQGITFSRVPYIYDFYLKWFTKPTKNLTCHLNAFAGQDGIGIKALDPEVDPSKEILNTFNFVWTNRDAFVSGGVNWLLGDKLSLSILGGYENWVSETDGSFLERGSRPYSKAFVDRFGALLGISEGDTFSVDAESSFTSTTSLHHFQIRLDSDYTVNPTLTLNGGAGAYLSRFRYDSVGNLWGISYLDDGTPVYRKDIFSTKAEDNDILVSFAYLGLEREWLPELLRMEAGLRIDHGYFWGEGAYTLNTVPVLGPRILLRYTPYGGSPAPLTFSLGTGIFSKVPFESMMITKDMGLSDYDVKVPKSFTSVLGLESYFGDGFRFKIETYYKYLYDRFYYNILTKEESGSTRTVAVKVHNDGVGHAGGFDILLDRRTSRTLDGMLSYSFIIARYRNPESDGIQEEDAQEPRGRWYYPSFHRFHSVNLLLNYKPNTWFTLTTRLSFATGTPLPRFGDKEMFFARFENQNGTGTIAEMYTRRSYYDDLNRYAWVLPLDIRLSFHFYKKGSKVYQELYLGAEDILSPLYTSLRNSRGAITTDRYTGEDTDSPDAGFSFPVVSIGYRASY